LRGAAVLQCRLELGHQVVGQQLSECIREPSVGDAVDIDEEPSKIAWFKSRRPARMDWTNLDSSRRLLEQTNAFVDANDAEDRGLHLLDPSTRDPALTTREPT